MGRGVNLDFQSEEDEKQSVLLLLDGFLHGHLCTQSSHHGFAEQRWRLDDVHASVLQGFELLLGRSLATADDRTGVPAVLPARLRSSLRTTTDLTNTLMSSFRIHADNA